MLIEDNLSDRKSFKRDTLTVASSLTDMTSGKASQHDMLTMCQVTSRELLFRACQSSCCQEKTQLGTERKNGAVGEALPVSSQWSRALCLALAKCESESSPITNAKQSHHHKRPHTVCRCRAAMSASAVDSEWMRASPTQEPGTLDVN